jgi:hypothetical protein
LVSSCFDIELHLGGATALYNRLLL